MQILIELVGVAVLVYIFVCGVIALLRKQKPSQDKEKGFTLTEFMVVLAIAGILAAIALGHIQSKRQQDEIQNHPNLHCVNGKVSHITSKGEIIPIEQNFKHIECK